MAVRKRTWTTAEGKKNSVWKITYLDQQGRRRSESRRTQKEALARELQILGEIRDRVHTPAGESNTLAEAGLLWLANGKANGLERSTLQNYRIGFEKHIKPYLGSIRLTELTTLDVEAYKDETMQRLSRKYARAVLNFLKDILNNARRLELIKVNVAEVIRLPRPTLRDRKLLKIGQDVPSKADIQAIIAGADDHWRTLIVMAAFSGLRSSELRGLRWQDIDLKKRSIRVERRADLWGDIGPPKSAAGLREVPLMPVVARALQEWRRAYPFRGGELVFWSRPSRNLNVPISHGSLWLWFRAAQLTAGIVDAAGKPKYPVHALRHFFASLGIEAGVPPKRLQEMLGHASIRMTYDRYGHLFADPEGDQALMSAMERSAFGTLK